METMMPDQYSDNAMKKKIGQLEQKVHVLSTQNQFFELLINNLPGLFYLFDSDFKVHKWNKNVEAVTGFSTDEVQTRHLFELFTGNDLIQIQKSIEETFIKGSADTEAILKTKDDRSIPYYFTGASTRLEDKQFLIGMGID